MLHVTSLYIPEMSGSMWGLANGGSMLLTGLSGAYQELKDKQQHDKNTCGCGGLARLQGWRWRLCRRQCCAGG